MPELLPTGRCFDDAIEYLAARVKGDPALAHGKTLRLVHGLARAHDAAGTVYAHAWCEDGEDCWDAALLEGRRVYYRVARVEYYAARQIEETTHYTVRQAARANRRTRSYGPWKPQYLECCGSGRTIFGAVPGIAIRQVWVLP